MIPGKKYRLVRVFFQAGYFLEMCNLI